MSHKLLRIGALLCALIFSSLSLGQNIPLDHFLKHSDYLDSKISPDGKYLAARLRENQRVYLTIIDLENNKVSSGVNPPMHFEVTRYDWVNNERVIYSIAQKWAHRDAPVGTGELFGVSIDGSQSQMLAGYRASDERGNTRISNRSNSKASFRVISELKNDPKNVLVAEYRFERDGDYYVNTGRTRPIVSKMDVKTGRKRKVEMIDFPGAALSANAFGEINFLTYTTEDATINAMYRENQEGEWKLVENVFDAETDVEVVGVTDQGDKIYLRMTDRSNGINSLYELDLGTRATRKLFNNSSADIEDWVLDSNNEVVVGVSYPDRAEYHYDEQNDSKIIALHKMLRKAFSNQIVTISSIDASGVLAIVKVRSDINPGEYYLFNAETKEAQFLFANYSWLDPRKMRPKTPISFTARDGVKVNGYLTLPATASKTNKAPLVVLPHGGPHYVRDFPFFDWEVQLLANRGYAVLQPNFRGSGGYGDAFVRLGFREWGGNMINDIIDATHYAIESHAVDKENVCIYGHSYGAYAAIMASSKAPELYQCTIGSAGLYDITDISDEGMAATMQGGKAYLRRWVGTDPKELKANSPTYHAAQIKSKVLLIHGDQDLVTEEPQYKKMLKAFKSANKNIEALLIRGAGHGTYSLENRQTHYTKVLSFLDKHIGGE